MLWGEGGPGLPPATHPGQEPSRVVSASEGESAASLCDSYRAHNWKHSSVLSNRLHTVFKDTETEPPFKCSDQRPLVSIIRDTVLTFQIIASHRAVSARWKWERKGQVGIKSVWRHMPQVEDIVLKDGC